VTPTTPASTLASRATETLAFFRDQLVEHFAIEEELVFPALRRAFAAASAERALLERVTAEHRELEALRDRIELATDDADLSAALTAFAELLERHVRTEERGLFAHFPGALPTADVARLTTAVHARRPPDGAPACKAPPERAER